MKYLLILLVFTALMVPSLGCPGSNTINPTNQPTTVSENTPHYGGTLVMAQLVWGFPFSEPGQDQGLDNSILSSQVYEPLAYGDWSRGPGGTGEFSFGPDLQSINYNESSLAGIIADSWEISQDGLILTVYLRHGVRFHNKAPAYGREVTAEDVKFCYERRLSQPQGYSLKIASSEVKVRVVDLYTVAFDLKKFDYRILQDILTGSDSLIYPHEAVDPSTGKLLANEVCGTGPYMLTDWVGGTSMTFDKNPSYYLHDELHSDSTLPYVDKLVCIWASSAATVSALRTGKLDINLQTLPKSSADSLRTTNPDIQIYPSYYQREGIYMHMDSGPLSDVRVRRALQMAIDGEALNKQLGAENVTYTGFYSPDDGTALYTPFDELPSSIKEQYTFDIKKAKELLADAGYRSGFSVELIDAAGQTSPLGIETAIANWAQLGVKVNLSSDKNISSDAMWQKTREFFTEPGGNVMMTWWLNGGPDCTIFQMVMSGSPTTGNTVTHSSYNYAFGDAEFGSRWDKIYRTVDRPQRSMLIKQATLYAMENTFVIGLATIPSYVIAQPWVKGWHGESMLRDGDYASVVSRLWIDPEHLKPTH